MSLGSGMAGISGSMTVSTSFQVLKLNGQDVPYGELGLKDTVLVAGEAELLVHVKQSATREVPFMFHCHILEHEDAGMMGQFTVG